MEYLASEIIERAKNLADIGNTDYISHQEASQYLNDAYSYVYQLAINRGDNFFVKYEDITQGTYRLPRDFYQLRSIKNPSSGYLYSRKSANASINEPGYEIINNKLIMSGVNNRCELSYYPQPKLMSFPDKSKETEIPIPNGIYSLWNDNLVYFNNEEESDTYTVYKISTGETTRIDAIDQPSAIYTSNNYFIAKVNEDYIYFDFNGNELKKEQGVAIFRKLNGDLTVLADYKVNYKGAELNIDETDYIQAGQSYLYYISDNKLYRQDIETNAESELLTEETIVNTFAVVKKFSRDYLIFNSNDTVYAYRDDWGIIPLDIDYDQLIGYTTNNVIISDGVVVKAISNEPDMLLNYPNNAYYTILCYQLACYFVAKQGGDTSILAQQLEKAKFDFEDNSQDAFTYPRIKNIY